MEHLISEWCYKGTILQRTCSNEWAGLSMILLSTTKTGFPMTRPIYDTIIHGGESLDLRTSKNGEFLSKSLDSGKTFSIFPLILIRLAWGLKQIPPQNESSMSIVSIFQTKDQVKKLLTSNGIFPLLVNNFLTRSLSLESRI